VKTPEVGMKIITFPLRNACQFLTNKKSRLSANVWTNAFNPVYTCQRLQNVSCRKRSSV